MTDAPHTGATPIGATQSEMVPTEVTQRARDRRVAMIVLLVGVVLAWVASAVAWPTLGARDGALLSSPVATALWWPVALTGMYLLLAGTDRWERRRPTSHRSSARGWPLWPVLFTALGLGTHLTSLLTATTAPVPAAAQWAVLLLTGAVVAGLLVLTLVRLRRRARPSPDDGSGDDRSGDDRSGDDGRGG